LIPKRHILGHKHTFWCIDRQDNQMQRGHVVKKATNSKETTRFDKSCICPRCATATKVVMWGVVLDKVNHAKFHPNQLSDFDSRRD